ncbi:hypothetical protein [Nocardia abscessus]|uniref:hypothetical protein n=1 Tax=Nocardia abscessus TaxID=120957 RepID=UPI0024544E76|nr:hypothetical protein [Nocardia abscessus]
MTIPKTAIIFMDRGRMTRLAVELEAAGRELAAHHGLTVAGVVIAPANRPDVLDATLERIARADITAIITPGLSHIKRQTHRIRRACQLMTIHPPATYARLRPQSRNLPSRGTTLSWIMDYCDDTNPPADHEHAQGLLKLHAPCTPPCPRKHAAQKWLARQDELPITEN